MTVFSYTISQEIRFADLDAYGHVNNALYFTYLENARVRLFEEHFGHFLDNELLFVVARAECDYHKPIGLHDRLQITLETSLVKHSSFEFHYRLHDGGGQIFATARTLMVCFDPRSGKPVVLPDQIREFFRSTASS